MILPSIAINTKKINDRGEFQPYYGYTIAAGIDNRLTDVARNMEYIIRFSSLGRSYAPLPANTYHMSIYTIFSAGNKLIPPVQRWVNATRKKVSKTNWLPHEVLEKQNNEATCVLAYYLHQPLIIKNVKLDINDNIIGLILELHEESLQRIRSARKELQKLYDHPNKSLEPINKKLHITLAYAYRKIDKVDVQAQRDLEGWARWFIESNLLNPYVYLYSSVANYQAYKKRTDVDCRAYDFWKL